VFSNRLARVFLFSCLAVFMLAGPAPAEESGMVAGRVADTSNNSLRGARVHFDQAHLTVVTDSDGRFAVGGLEAGHYTVTISYTGFISDTREVEVAAGAETPLEAKLHPDLHVSETVTVTASRPRGEVEALNQQQAAQNEVNVLPADVITSLPNTNVADALGRLPSVSLERDEGEGKYVQIRGTEPRLSNFEINGVHIPSPESSVRNVKLDIIPSDLVGTLELHKTLTPDQDADAIGGSVNLVTKTAGDQPYVRVSGQGGYTDSLGGRPLYQTDATYSKRFGVDKATGLLIGGSYDWNGRGINDIEPSPGTTDLGQGPIPVFSAMDVREYRYERSRLGLAGSLDHRLGPGSSLFLRGLLADFKNYGDRWVSSPSAGSFLTSTQTDDSGSMERTVQNRRPHEQIYSLAAGGQHDLGRLAVDYTVSYSHSQQNRLNQLQATYAGPDDVAFNVNASDPYFPQFTPTNGVDINDPSLYTLDTWRVSNEKTFAHDTAAAFNLSLRHQGGVFKAGAKYRDEHKENDVNDVYYSATGAPSLSLASAQDPFSDPNYYFGRYPLGPLPSLSATQAFVTSNPSSVIDDPFADRLKNDPNNFTARERVTAAYAMDTLKLGAASLAFGLRLEHTNAGYTGNKVVADAKGHWVSTNPVSGDNSYTDVLPSVNLRYEIDGHTNLRAAYGRGLSRPDFGDLPPYFVESDKKQTISAGNPDLQPTHSNNYDLMVEHYLSTVGVLSAGFFYKDLKDPIYPGVETDVAGGPYDGWTQTQAINGPKAHIAGFELFWQQHLTFLPGALSGFGVMANYTHTQSKATVPGRTDEPQLLRTTPNLFNVGLTYDKGAFSARAAVTYNDANIWEYNYSPGADLGIPGPNGDVYLYPHTQLDAQASYTFRNGLQVLANMLNVNNEVFGFYQGSPQYQIQREYYGWSLSLGLRYVR